MTLEDYYEKRKKAQVCEARDLVENYRRVYDRNPDEEAMSEFFWLFSNDADQGCMPPRWRHQMMQAGNIEYSMRELGSHKKGWPDMQAFLASIPWGRENVQSKTKDCTDHDL